MIPLVVVLGPVARRQRVRRRRVATGCRPDVRSRRVQHMGRVRNRAARGNDEGRAAAGGADNRAAVGRYQNLAAEPPVLDDLPLSLLACGRWPGAVPMSPMAA